jgi:HD-like signal output (HDOD) protein
VNDVKTAVTRVGFEAVRSVAVAVAMEQLRAADDLAKYARRAESAWRHSVEVAAHAYVIAQKVTRLNPEEALFAGLIEDIGYFYLLSQAVRYPELDAEPEALDAVLADWHAPIGQAVLHSFRLSDATLAAVAEHENGSYTSPPRTIADVVVMANLATANGNPIYNRAGAPQPPTLDEPAILQMLTDAHTEVRSLVAALRQ